MRWQKWRSSEGGVVIGEVCEKAKLIGRLSVPLAHFSCVVLCVFCVHMIITLPCCLSSVLNELGWVKPAFLSGQCSASQNHSQLVRQTCQAIVRHMDCIGLHMWLAKLCVRVCKKSEWESSLKCLIRLYLVSDVNCVAVGF